MVNWVARFLRTILFLKKKSPRLKTTSFIHKSFCQEESHIYWKQNKIKLENSSFHLLFSGKKILIPSNKLHESKDAILQRFFKN